MKKERPVSFPPFRLDKVNQQLWHGSHPIELRRKTFLVLQYLVEHPGRLVTKEELRNAVWPNVYVSDTVLKVCIRELRRVLGEHPAAPRFIETIHGRGYRFIGQKQGDRFQEFVGENQKTKTQGSLKARGERPKGPPLLLLSSRQSAAYSLAQHLVLDARDWRSPTHGPQYFTPTLVGRESELAQLHGWLAQALSGERQFVFVSGEPGIGKTTLVDAFLSRMARQELSNGQREVGDGGQKIEIDAQTLSNAQSLRPSLWIARGQCIAHYGVAEPYLPVLDALSRVCREPGHEWLITHLSHYAPLWLAQMPSLLSPADRKNLQRELVGASRERMLREITEALEALTRATPLIFVLEDLHWSDSATLDLLSFLARRREPARLLVIGTHRPMEIIAKDHPLEEVKRELHMHRHCQELPLPRLTANALAHYLTQRFPDNLFPLFLPQWLHQHTSGNPLFLVNIVDSLVTRGVIMQRDNQWMLASDFELAPFDIPTDLQAVIEEQSDHVSPEEAQVLQAASVAGMEFSTALVAAALNSDIGAVEKSCEGLAQRQLFLSRRGLSEWSDGTLATCYGFLHVLYQRAWYKRLTPARRVQWHRAVGGRLETAYGERAHEIAAELAVHFEHGRDPHRTVHYLRQRAENAGRCGSFREAQEHLLKGLELLKALPDSPERRQQELVLQTQLGLIIQAYKGPAAPEAERAFAQARKLCQQIGEPAQLFHVLRGLSGLYQVRGELWKAQELAEQCLSLAEQLQNSALLTAAHSVLGVVLALHGELISARMHLEQGLTLHDYRQPALHSDSDTFFAAYHTLSCHSFIAFILLGLGYPDQALKKTQESLLLAQAQSHPFSLTWTIYRAAEIHLARQEWSLAQERAEAVITLATEYGFLQWQAMGVMLRGAAQVAQGQEEEGLIQLQQGLAIYQDTGAEAGRPFYLALLAKAYWQAGQYDKGYCTLDEALHIAHKNGQCLADAHLHWLKGELTLQKEARDWGFETDPLPSRIPNATEQKAEEYFQKAIEIAQNKNAKWLELHVTMSLCQLWRQQGKKDEARQVLSEIYSWFTEGFDTVLLQEAKKLLKALV